MARDDRFRKYQEAGADFLETARARAEEFLAELAQVGGASQKQAQDAFDDMMGSSRRGTEQIVNAIRTEIAAQFSLIGVATRQELDDLERRLTARIEAAGQGAGPAKKGAGVKKAATKKAAAAGKAGPGTKAASANKAASATEAASTKKAGPAKKAASTKKAGPAKKAPVHKRTGED